MPPLFGPTQFVQCKVDAGKDDEGNDLGHFIAFLPGTGRPEGLGKAQAGFLTVGHSRGHSWNQALWPRPPRRAPPNHHAAVFGPMQFVQCKVDAGKDAKGNDLALHSVPPRDGRPEGFGKALAGFLNCGPLPGLFKEP